MSPRTLARQSEGVFQSQREQSFLAFSSRDAVYVHWLDNFSRHFAGSAMHPDRDLFHNLNWSAHGAKLIPTFLSVSWVDNKAIDSSACPPLERVLDKGLHESIVRIACDVSIHQFDSSFVRVRGVTRIPIKAQPLTPLERLHYEKSYDGLRTFVPADIYADNVQSKDGLLRCLSYVLRLCGAGSPDHPRNGLYSFLLLDVSTYWMLVRLLYSFPCFAPMRHDLYVLFGFWHPYSYANVAIWNCFRETFIGPAFFHIWPKQKLLRRPTLVKCTTFFTFLRLCYPSFRSFLLETLGKLRVLAISFDVESTNKCVAGGTPSSNPYRSRIVHLYNMFTLFEFCIPVLHDYIALLKHNDWYAFRMASMKLLILFMLIHNRGADAYRPQMYFFMLMTMRWCRDDHVIMRLFRENHTIFSEESGEIALSVLANSQPSSTRSSLQDTRQFWQAVYTRRKAAHESASAGQESLKSRFRRIGLSLSLVCVCIHVYVYVCVCVCVCVWRCITV